MRRATLMVMLAATALACDAATDDSVGTGGAAGTGGATGTAGTTGSGGATQGQGGSSGAGATSGAGGANDAAAPTDAQACTYADPNQRYLGRNAADCAAMKFGCGDTETYFSDACGCGCVKAPSDCSVIECFRAVTCVTSCGAAPVSVGCCPCAAPAFDDIQCPRDAGSKG